MSYIMKIKCNTPSGVNVRTAASTSGSRIGAVPKGTTCEVSAKQQGSDYMWYQIKWNSKTGWVASGPNGSWWIITEQEGVIDRAVAQPVPDTRVAQVAVATSASIQTAPKASSIPPDVVQSVVTDFSADLSQDAEFGSSVDLYSTISSYYNEIYSGGSADNTIRSVNSIIGMPFQFIPSTDERLARYNYGRMYTENIILNAPVANISVGGPKFLSGSNVTNDDRNKIANILANSDRLGADAVSAMISDLIDGSNARYYSFMTQHTVYMTYVNTMCRLFSQYLGIGNLKYKEDTAYESYDYKNEMFENDAGNTIERLFGSNQSVNVYFNPQSSLQENNSNSTEQSKLASALDTVSDAAKEASYLMGVGFSNAVGANGNTEASIADIAKLVNNSNPNVISRLFGRANEGMRTTLAGANMLFPDIWKNSNFSRSYQLEVTLSSPYGNAESVFLHVLKPLSFLLCMGFPRQYGANGYAAPFLIQAHSKGLFNCEMGIIDSISIERGGNGDAISYNDLPLEIRVTITFKDLYESLSITKYTDFSMLANNIGLIDYIATLSGVSTNKPAIMRSLDIFIQSKINRIRDIPGNIKSNILDSLRDVMMNAVKF